MTHPAAEVINYSKDHGANVSFHIQMGYLVVLLLTHFKLMCSSEIVILYGIWKWV